MEQLIMSNCCDAPVVEAEEKSGFYYRCTKCGKECFARRDFPKKEKK